MAATSVCWWRLFVVSWACPGGHTFPRRHEGDANSMKATKEVTRAPEESGRGQGCGDLVSRDVPTIALSGKWYAPPDRFRWMAADGFALEYTPNPEALDTLPEHVDPFLQTGLPVRYHGFFPGYEIGHPDTEYAESAVRMHMRAIEALIGRGEQAITFHIGIDFKLRLDETQVVANLRRLVEFGQDRGVTVSIENLRRGASSDPETLLTWAESSGALITFDVGHARSSRRAREGVTSAMAYLEQVAHRLHEVHVYGREADRHYPPRDMHLVGALLERALATNCAWWTIELDDRAEALATREMVLDYLQARGFVPGEAGVS
jgi:sugar phosphate isomerase/epimerase